MQNSATHKNLDSRLQAAIKAGLGAVHAGSLVKDWFVRNQNAAIIDFSSYKKIYIVGIGKCAEKMSIAAADCIDNFAAGIVLSNTENFSPQAKAKFTCLAGDHPIVSTRNIEASEQILDLCAKASKNDLVLSLVSGGSSALFEVLREGVELVDFQQNCREMLLSGADIFALNKMRASYSQVKHGGFLKKLSHTNSATLIISDVIGDDLATIGSAPTLGSDRNFVIGNIECALSAICSQLESEAIVVERLDGLLTGIASEEALRISEKLKSMAIAYPNKTQALVWGGECTVKVSGDGIGGRNQELALVALRELMDQDLEFSFVALATDGVEGNSNLSGAFFNRTIISRVKKLQLDIQNYLLENNSTEFWQRVEGELDLRPTHTNVMDFGIAIIQSK